VTTDKRGARDLADTSWAHGPVARTVRGWILCYVLRPILEHYTHPTVLGSENLDELEQPVIFAANHSSHIDTPLLLQALPEKWRRRTVVAAAADYFFRNRLIAGAVALVFGAVPIERNARPSRDAAEGLSDLVRSDCNVVVYPEGTRSRDGTMGSLRSGAARMALERDVAVVPICLSGTHAAMPPGRWWPRRHRAIVAFGAPLTPLVGEDHKLLTARLEEALVALRLSLGEET
jgi:1-acyl-sn-glycerol-3-phosphate acyltransferase